MFLLLAPLDLEQNYFYGSPLLSPSLILLFFELAKPGDRCSLLAMNITRSTNALILLGTPTQNGTYCQAFPAIY